MKPSERLRGRAKSFRLDQDHVSALLDSYGGDSQAHIRDLQDRKGGYGIAADELNILADELEREGQ